MNTTEQHSPGTLAWQARNTFAIDHSANLRRLASIKAALGCTTSVVIPVLNEARTIGSIVSTIRGSLMNRDHIVDRLLVIDGGSSDDTVRIARASGAEVVSAASLLPDVEPVRGKGDSLWRSLSLVDTDLVAWIDGDIRNFSPRFVSDLFAPLMARPDIDFVKGFYRRPLQVADLVLTEGGGRVTELLAKPLLSSLFPELNGFHQPLAGEYAIRTAIARDLPIFTGYSVEAAMLIDLLHSVGIERMGQADLGTRVHRNRPLAELGVMAHGITRTVLRRAEDYGRLAHGADILSAGAVDAPDDVERPAISLLVDAAGAGAHRQARQERQERRSVRM